MTAFTFKFNAELVAKVSHMFYDGLHDAEHPEQLRRNLDAWSFGIFEMDRCARDAEECLFARGVRTD